MRISTTQLYNMSLDNILRKQAELSVTQNKIATGRRINIPSDDPIGASQAIMLKAQMARSSSYLENVSAARNSLELEESTITSAVNVLQRVRELQIQANNSILSKTDRQAITSEMKTRLDELLGLANTKDARGAYMFSGFQSHNVPFASAGASGYTYQGDDGQRLIEVAPGMTVPVSDSGYSLFENIPNGDGDVQISEPGAPNTGSVVLTNYQVIDTSQFVPEDYMLTFVNNSQGVVGYQVVGSVSGQLIPALPATTPASAPAYTNGQTINFNGVQLTLSGTPNPGDNFLVQPSEGQSVFASIQQMIDAMDLDSFTPSQAARLINQSNSALNALDQALGRFTDTRTQIGSRLSSLDTAEDLNEDFQLHGEALVSRIEDLDLAEAITELNQKTLILQAAQQSFVKIQGLSLFNMI